jgi:hypothetical protein
VAAVLFPLRIIRMDPRGLGLGAHAAGRCRCEDGFDYVLKDGSAHATTPHDEWLCTQLATRVGIACPPCALIRDGAGGHYFGSRIEGGLMKDPWWESIARGDMDLDIVAPVLTRILAFDFFVHNDDRHLLNYVARDTDSGWGLHAVDFSRAWTFHGFPPPALPFRPQANTVFAHRELKQIIGDFVDVGVAADLLDKLAATPASVLERIINDHPPEWLSPQMRDTILGWWDSAEKAKRIESIRKGIADGSYL